MSHTRPDGTPYYTTIPTPYTEEGEKIIDNPDFCKVPIYEHRNYEMFDGMRDGTKEDGYGYFPWTPIKYGCFSPELAKELREKETRLEELNRELSSDEKEADNPVTEKSEQEHQNDTEDIAI